MYTDDDFLPISALQHFMFCERQCALIHIEQVWSENLLTAEGRVMHDRAHEERHETRNGVRIERGMPLRSLTLGLIGKADVIEFRKSQISDFKFEMVPFPVEYKRGKPKANDCDKVQLCAQALCLEEMLGTPVPAGSIFYGKTRHRLDVAFDETLRRETQDVAMRLHEFMAAAVTPRPVYSKRCDSCSLVEVCMPKTFERQRSVAEYLKEVLADNETSA